MKKMLVLLVAMVLGVLILAACGPVAGAQGFVQLDPTLKAGISAVILWVISWVIVQLVTLWKPLQFLDQYKEQIAMAISAALIGWIESVTPDAYGSAVVAGIQFLLIILALFGVGRQLAARNVRGFKSRA